MREEPRRAATTMRTHLRFGSDTADLDVAESELEQSINSSGVLVKACSDSNRVVELASPDLRMRGACQREDSKARIPAAFIWSNRS